MATPSPEPKSWDRLLHQARSAPAPAGVDLRTAIRTEISSSPVRLQTVALFDDVLSLCRSRWLQGGFAALALAAVLACRESMDVVNELAWIWQFQGPVVSGI